MKKSRYTYMYTFILSCVLMTVMNITTAETFDRGDIKFKRGSSSGTVSGAVVRGDRDQYFMMAGAGQWMEVKISSLENNAVFQLSIYQYGTGEDVQLEGAENGDDAYYWYGKLPRPGYSKDGKQNAVDIVVGGTRGNASYDLTVTIKNRSWQQAASFNCKKASTQAERMICNNSDLRAADAKMADAYKRLLEVLPKSERKLLKADQRNWLKERNIEFQSCQEAYCHVFYLVRIEQLNPVEQVGFNCKKASTRVERKICNSRLLKHADGRMAAVYKELLNFDEGGQIDRQEQRNWLKSRNRQLKKQSCGTSCAWQFYKERIGELARRLLH